MADKKQRLVLSIIDFLTESMGDGTVKEEDKEGLEVAAQSIGEAFGVDPANAQQRERLSVKPANLQSVFDVFLKTREKVSTEASSSSTKTQPSQADKAQAEKFKQTGNAQMSRKEYAEAIQSYADAISHDPTNPVYYSNRAAAHSSMGDHPKAIEDAEMAIATDPKFVKAFSRLGHAHYSLGDFTAAASAFRRGLELEPGNANLKSGLDQAETHMRPETPPPPLVDGEVQDASRSGGGAGGMPDLSAMGDMLRGMGGAGGGMPDMAGLMSNPAIMQMAQRMMANGGLEQLMQNPALSGMMNRMQSGGGMPSMQEMMSNPALRDLASSFTGAGAGGAPDGAPGGTPGGQP